MEQTSQESSSDHKIWDNVAFRYAYHQLPSYLYCHIKPTPLKSPQWVHWNHEFASSFGLVLNASDELLAEFSGNQSSPLFQPIATKYVGHQFGYYNPDLGDGRGLLLGEIYHENQQQWYEIHIKGSGPTPYSRGADGRAVLRSSIREYLMSEALHHLGVPTTRALGLLTSQTPVQREIIEDAAICIRMSPSHIRFGHFEYLYHQNDKEGLYKLADFCIENYYPRCAQSSQPYHAFFHEVTKRTAELIASWQAFGFAHGVLNTDNMSILGLSFDFGPFAFLDGYQPHFICNHSDTQGRYRFSNQPAIGLWNLQVLAQALSPLIKMDALQEILKDYETHINQTYLKKMSLKIGVDEPDEKTSILIGNLLDILEIEQTDYTRFFRELSNLDKNKPQNIFDLFVDTKHIRSWLEEYSAYLNSTNLSFARICPKMREINPKYILRNYLLEQAIQSAQSGDFSEVHRLFTLIQAPYEEQVEFEHYANLPPQWAQELNISCSS